jgi:hypothetical protein
LQDYYPAVVVDLDQSLTGKSHMRPTKYPDISSAPLNGIPGTEAGVRVLRIRALTEELDRAADQDPPGQVREKAVPRRSGRPFFVAVNFSRISILSSMAYIYRMASHRVSRVIRARVSRRTSSLVTLLTR